jgi:Fe-S oxidoreductase
MKFRSFQEYLDKEKVKFIESCDFEGMCLEVCHPLHLLDLKISNHDLLRKMVSFLKEGTYSQEVYDFVYACSLCGCCENKCHKDINFIAITEVIKAELNKAGHKPPPVCSISLPRERNNIMRVMESLQIKPSERRWVTRVPDNPEPKEVVLFLSCYVHQMPHIIFTCLDILESLGVNFVAIGGVDNCCGYMDLLMGSPKISDGYAKRIATAVKAYQPKTALFLCASCFYRFKYHFPLFMDIPFEVKPLQQFFHENIDRIEFAGRLDEKVTYHDSCGLGRRCGLFEEPRELIKSIPGVELVEMNPNREEARCCAGLNLMTNPPVANVMGKELGRIVNATGTNKVITTCTGCFSILGLIGQQDNFSTEYYATLLGRAMGIEYEDKLATYRNYRDPKRVLQEARDCIEASPFSQEEMEKLNPQFFPGE